jgi:hypothetical protein
VLKIIKILLRKKRLKKMMIKMIRKKIRKKKRKKRKKMINGNILKMNCLKEKRKC